MTVRRSIPVTLLLALGGALVLLTLGRSGAALALTVTAAVAILAGLCLEAALVRVLQPERPRLSRTAAALLAGHLCIWAVFLAGVFRWRESVELWAVAAGVGCFLLGLSVAGVSTRTVPPREE